MRTFPSPSIATFAIELYPVVSSSIEPCSCVSSEENLATKPYGTGVPKPVPGPARLLSVEPATTTEPSGPTTIPVMPVDSPLVAQVGVVGLPAAQLGP